MMRVHRIFGSISVCLHHPLKCVQIVHEDFVHCMTKFNHWTTVKDLMDQYKHELLHRYPMMMLSSQCSLYSDDQDQLDRLNETDYIEDILLRNFLLNRQVKFRFHCQSLRFARRRKLSQHWISPSSMLDFHEHSMDLMKNGDESKQQGVQRRSSVDRDIDLLVSVGSSMSISESLHFETLV